ncbi:alpha/beta hydrolase [Chitinimonas sp.]|uniref:alpha/beta hydrolase n=1 Tax=Chitinimonas sp. TaxID=1934313 RepID=UPI002F944D5B
MSWPKCLAVGLMALIGLGGSAQAGSPADAPTPIALWPGKVPDPLPVPGPETETLRTEHLIAGRPWTAVTNITQPTMTVYPPTSGQTGAAVVVMPGGGFHVLAMDLEGTEVCDWLTSRGITCVLLKYRVPSPTYDWHCDCRPDNLAIPRLALEDAQRAIRLLRQQASRYGIQPDKIGVLGFSAGGYLVASISTQYARRLYPPVDEADRQSARPDFAIALYPGHLVTKTGKLNPNVPVTANTPPTFLLHAGDDPVDKVKNTQLYYAALQAHAVPAELHLYAQGGHAFGLRPSALPISGWPRLVEGWLQSIGIVPG